ncbi:septal ring lytic transglycosylase RlpA family protein [Amycolatopsis samaneae]|uniref:Septal ring lytic transglycosylase RlpA family protein n=1 Tax=Amycolatopsis samaneae TaxID=664691 RepID=A0ABW5GRS6_9PSEU
MWNSRGRSALAVGTVVAAAALMGTVAGAAEPVDVPPKGQNCWATHYGPIPAGSRTANGELYDGNAMTAATSLSRDPQLPFGTKLKVTNVANNRSVTVRVNDRGTYTWSSAVPKCLDLTDGAFAKIGQLTPDPGHLVVKTQIVK